MNRMVVAFGAAVAVLGVGVAAAKPADAVDAGSKIVHVFVHEATAQDSGSDVAAEPAKANSGGLAKPANAGSGAVQTKQSARPTPTGTPVLAGATPSGGQSTAIAWAAVHRNRFLGEVPASDLTVSNIRVARGAGWASALLSPKDHRTDPAQAVLRHTAAGWRVVDFGTDGVGCSLPRGVRPQLHLWGGCA